MALFEYLILTVHPHVCGEHMALEDSESVGDGSSPRVWGALAVNAQADVQDTGSSPRVWGASTSSVTALPRWRFIPTCVGSIRCKSACYRAYTVHPHVCGEHADIVSVKLPAVGSSPRVWGACCHRRQAERPGRFIPTCVGSIHRADALHFQPTVHPHVCGEHFTTPRP